MGWYWSFIFSISPSNEYSVLISLKIDWFDLLAVLHYLPKFVQVHVHCINDAIQPSHPLMPSSALNLSQHHGLFQWVGCSHQVTKILELHVQHQSFQWVSRVDFLKIDWFDLLFVQGVFSSTTVWRHQFFGALPSLQSSSHSHTWPLGRP